MFLGIEKGTVGALGQCTYWTMIPLRSRTMNHHGRGGQNWASGHAVLHEMRKQTKGAMMLCSVPCGDKQVGEQLYYARSTLHIIQANFIMWEKQNYAKEDRSPLSHKAT